MSIANCIHLPRLMFRTGLHVNPPCGWLRGLLLATLLICLGGIGQSVLMSEAAAQSLASQIEVEAGKQYQAILKDAASKKALAPDNYPDLIRLRKIHQRILPFTYAVNPRAREWQWEVNLVGSKQINAFCMPGGKIMFFTGILDTLKLTDDEVGIVMGHEVAHALREHSVDRYKKTVTGDVLARLGGALAAQLLGIDPGITDLAAHGLKQLALLKYSRNDEVEADVYGLELAARAGFDPRAGVALWKKMGQAAGNGPPQWLSTHPAGENRIRKIEERMPKMLPIYARAIGQPADKLPPYKTTALK